MSNETYNSALKRNRISDTKQRRQVFEFLRRQKEPVQISLVVSQNKDIHKATIYRIVDTFEKAEIVKKVFSGLKQHIELGELFRSHHHHITCDQCSRSTGFDEPSALIEIFSAIADEKKYTLTSHALELTGLCRSCSSSLQR